MKSFSFKALALAFTVVAGSANAGIVDTVKGYASTVNTKLFGNSTTYVDVNGSLVELQEAMEQYPAIDFSNADKTVHYESNGYMNAIDAKLFGKVNTGVSLDTLGNIEGGILPNCFYFNSGYKRAAFAVVATAAVTAAVVKTYKHFTKPAADATEGEAVEANEANTVA